MLRTRRNNNIEAHKRKKQETMMCTEQQQKQKLKLIQTVDRVTNLVFIISSRKSTRKAIAIQQQDHE